MYTYHGIVERVIDGDTFEIVVDLGFDIQTTQVFRILNLDTYETRLIKETTEEQKVKGKKIKAFVSELLTNQEVMIKTYMKKGFYKRYLCDVYIKNEENGRDKNYATIPQLLGYDKNCEKDLNFINICEDIYGKHVFELIKKHKLF